ncbi:coiled-coil domain-containing protein 85C isoform X2 [Adelges cooleyi]|uniref:coiled-coil domain-containing protein 85C isoform X2 n=1 Tax=Adelges cooleyi TaxID=133065 RepID=UPI00217F3C34|nr:coiled-coil domain-containing protein 85C isoform X2 [Adelges cooleyi]
MSCVSGLPKNYNSQNTAVSQKLNVVIPPKYQPPPSPNCQYNVQLNNYLEASTDHRRQQGEKPYVNTSDNHRYRTLPEEQVSGMLKFVRKIDSDNSSKVSPEQIGQLMSEINSLKDMNQRLNDENQELRDLCCFLDDDRQKGRKLAREWQRFGRYTASVMRQEVAAYQVKLRHLEAKQQHLIEDNMELKELCLYLDEERCGPNRLRDNSVCRICGNSTVTTNLTEELHRRDEGDGSSSSTNADENLMTANQLPFHRQLHQSNDQNVLPDQRSINYIRQLEAKVKELEDEKNKNFKKLNEDEKINDKQIINWNVEGLFPLTHPESVMTALQVLELREQLESKGEDSNNRVDMEDEEKALLREMCNVVWRKLEDNH